MGELIASASLSIVKMWNVHSLSIENEIDSDIIEGTVSHLKFSPVSKLLYFACGENQKNTQLMAFNMMPKDPIINVILNTVNAKLVHINGLLFCPKVINKNIIDEFVVFG